MSKVNPKTVQKPMIQKWCYTPEIKVPEIFREKLYTDSEYEYYKVAVEEGKQLSTGAVSETCEKVGMTPVCSGPDGCKYTDEKCVVTPLSSACSNPMHPISQILCDGKSPNQCS